MDELKSKQKLLELERKRLAIVRERAKLEGILPHKYVPMYAWQREVYESKEKINLLTAANQVGKSSVLIRRSIANCTEPERWQKIFGLSADKRPRQFWYFYPDKATLEREVTTKWIPEWLPRGDMQTDPVYGWKLRRNDGQYNALEFKSGCTIYFQTYTKKVSSLQAGSISEIYADEELPMDFYDELMFRLSSTMGIFTSGFTPTLNQLFWKQAMEGDKVLPTAKKLVVSMYDCLTYEDGSPSRVMTMEKVRLAESRCNSETERQRRIYGRFVTEEGRLYYAFEYDTHVVPPRPQATDDHIYASVDYGSGSDYGKSGKQNHPAAIIFVAVKPDYKSGRVVECWRGDNAKTTAGDVFIKYQELSAKYKITQACYDPASIDFGTIADRSGVGFTKANKARESGIDMVNSLFRHDMLVIEDAGENLKLAAELMTVMVKDQQGPVKDGDDLCDALRYLCKMVPWDLSVVGTVKYRGDAPIQKSSVPKTEAEHLALQIRLRRGEDVFGDETSEQESSFEDEIEEWNYEYGAFDGD